MKNKSTRVRKFRTYAPERAASGEAALWKKKKIGVAKGFGPMHAENVLEGEIPDPVQERVLKLQGGSGAVSEENRRQVDEDEALAQRVLHRPDAKRKPIKGPQFSPGAGSPAESAMFRQLYDKLGLLVPEEQLYPDFIKTRSELSLDPMMAQGGKSDVPGLQGGTEKFMGPGAGDKWTAATRWGAWGDRLGPNSVAVSPADIASGKYQPGQWINTPRGWKQVQDTSWVEPGRPNPAGTLEYWLGGGKKGRRGGWGGGGGFDVNPATRRARGPYRDLSTPTGPLGMGTQFFETPESEFPRATPGPSGFQGSGQPVVGQGQVTVGGGGNFQPGVYTGTLGGPGDPGGSKNFWDYMNPWGGTSKGGSNTGDPTQRGVGRVVGTATNFFIPGGGYVTGPAARWLTSKIQNMLAHGASKGDIGRVVAQAQAKAPPMPQGSVDLPQGDTSTSGGGGWNPFSGLPQGFKESGRFGYGAPTFTGPGAFGGQFSGGSTFHGITANDITASGVNPSYGNFAEGQVGRSSVQAPSGGMSFMGISGPSNLSWGKGGWEGGDRPHFNPYFGGYSLDKPAGTPVALKKKGDKDLTAKNTDTVPAMLTPREAVLNRNAAELAGRGNIEQLNAQGNKLAEKGVDLAGGKNMKTKAKKMQGGGYVPKPGAIEQGDPAGGPNQLNQAQQNYVNRSGFLPPAFTGGTYSGGKWTGGAGQTPPVGGAFGGGGLPDMPGMSNLNQAQQNYQNQFGKLPPALTGGTYADGGWTGGAGQAPGAGKPFPMPSYGGGPIPVPGGGNVPPGLKGNLPPEGMPGAYNLNQGQQNYYNKWGQLPPGLGGPLQAKAYGGGGFYPHGMGMQGGTEEVPPGPIGSPNPQHAYGPPITLTAPQLQQAAQKAGLSTGQMQGLMQAVQGFGQGYNELTGGAGSAADMATAASGAYQGGISDIGYPPFVAPQAEYHADKGSTWIGSYDPSFMIQRY